MGEIGDLVNSHQHKKHADGSFVKFRKFHIIESLRDPTCPNALNAFIYKEC